MTFIKTNSLTSSSQVNEISLFTYKVTLIRFDVDVSKVDLVLQDTAPTPVKQDLYKLGNGISLLGFVANVATSYNLIGTQGNTKIFTQSVGYPASALTKA